MRLLSILAVVGLLVCVQVAQAALVTDELDIYDGTTVSSAGITLSAWGSGEATESTLRGSTMDGRAASIRIFSDSLYSGGEITFAKPAALYKSSTKTTGRYLVFMVKLPQRNTGGFAGGAGAFGNPATTQGPNLYPKNDELRFVFTEESGIKTAVKRVRGVPATLDGWITVGIPLSRLAIPENKGQYDLKKVVVTAEAPSRVVNSNNANTGVGGAVGGIGGPGGVGGVGALGTTGGTVSGTGDRRVFDTVEMYIGQIKTVLDSDPIRISALKQLYNQRYINEVLVQAEVDSGMAQLQYLWDFGDGTVPVEGTNLGSHAYEKQGTYTITLTVSDKDKVKEPVKKTVEVKMEW